MTLIEISLDIIAYKVSIHLVKELRVCLNSKEGSLMKE